VTTENDERVSTYYLGRQGEDYYAWQRGCGELNGRLTAPLFEEYLRPGNLTVVDFGCGSGELLAALPAAVRHGVEPNPAARAEAEKKGLTVHARTEDVPSESADVVISNHALEHALQPYKELVELRRVLRPGGKLVLVVPMQDWRAHRDPCPDVDQHVYGWTPRTLANLVRQAGFSFQSCEIVTRAWPPRYDALASLPRPVLAALEWLTAVAARRRQLRLLATKEA
jgi:SAM-dependent methyltransferase